MSDSIDLARGRQPAAIGGGGLQKDAALRWLLLSLIKVDNNVRVKKHIIYISTAAIALILWAIWPRTLFDAPTSTVLLDRHGELLGARIAADGQWRFPASKEVPEKFAACLIAFEDRRFKWHPGVDPLALARAMRQNIRAGETLSGGSTITMQVVRLSRNRPRNLRSKVVEAVGAVRLELTRSKRAILALYASNAPFGGNVVGLEAAAWRYFGHAPEQLSWAEAATLAVLPNAPAMLHLSRGRKTLLEKRNRLLLRLQERGIIDESTCLSALDESLPGEPLPLPQRATHLVDRMAQTHRGEQSTSTIDGALQDALNETLTRWNAEFSRNDIRDIAALILDAQTGEPLAYVGNASAGEASAVDIVRSPRSSGSILKPLLYCAALQEGTILPGTLLEDIPVNFNGFAPRNFSLQYDGAVPAGEAIARSLNVPAVNLLRAYGIPKFHDFLRRAGFSTLDRSPAHYGLSLILGGAETTLWEVAQAYYGLACAVRGEAQPPYTRAAAWQTLDAITQVDRPEELDWRAVRSVQTVGWKTGTSYGFRDAWAVGVTPRYVVAVWVGNANGEGRAGLTGALTAGVVMFDVFNGLPASEWFEQPVEEFVEAAVCRASGYLAGRFCTDVDTLLISPAGLRSAPCPYHVELQGERWFVLPPAQEWYYRQRHPSYRPVPQTPARVPMQFVYPQPGARLVLPRDGEGVVAPAVFRVAHSDPAAELFWHLDGNYVGSTELFHEVPLTPAPGRHTATVVDRNGHAISVSFSVDN